MKPVKLTLRIWIAVTSILSFLGGWALLSHSGKPVSIFGSSTDTGSAVNLNAALPPIPSLDQLVGNSTSSASSSGLGIQQLPSQSSNGFSNFVPSFRSRGS